MYMRMPHLLEQLQDFSLLARWEGCKPLRLGIVGLVGWGRCGKGGGGDLTAVKRALAAAFVIVGLTLGAASCNGAGGAPSNRFRGSSLGRSLKASGRASVASGGSRPSGASWPIGGPPGAWPIGGPGASGGSGPSGVSGGSGPSGASWPTSGPRGRAG